LSRTNRRAVILLLPTLLVPGVILLYPIWQLGSLSLHEISRFGQIGQFSGFANVSSILGDAEFRAAFVRTLWWTVLVVGGTFIISLPVALIMNVPFYGRSLVRFILVLPWAMSVAMSALVWRWALNGSYGMLNATLLDLGVILEPVQWLADADLAFPVQVIIGIIVSVPFTASVFLAGLTSIPRDVYDAAKVDGASPLTRILSIEVPLLKNFFTTAFIFNLIAVFNSFPIIWVITEGGPSGRSEILVTYLYKLAFRFGRLGDAAVISIIMFITVLLLSIAYAASLDRSTAKR